MKEMAKVTDETKISFIQEVRNTGDSICMECTASTCNVYEYMYRQCDCVYCVPIIHVHVHVHVHSFPPSLPQSLPFSPSLPPILSIPPSHSLPPSLLLSPSSQLQVQLLKSLHHPNILQFIGILYKERKVLVLITEYADGGTLRKTIKKTEKLFPWHLRISIARDIAAGMVCVCVCVCVCMH